MKLNGRAQSGKPRWVCLGSNSDGRRYCYSTTSPGAPKRDEAGATSSEPKSFKRALKPGARVFIITAAQNATPVHPAFWASLQSMAKHRHAEILVIPIRYKNPTSTWTASQANEDAWAEEVTPYLWNVRRALNENLIVLGDIKTQPTASDPVTGFDAISGASSAILGHTKIQLKCIPTPSNRMAKIITTTGAVTVSNYTDSSRGKKGEFHHSLAAVVVEVQGKKFHLRHLNFDKRTKSFTDLDTRYSPGKVEKAPRPLALVMGDTHVDFISAAVERATFGKGGLVASLKPRHLVWHDVLDAYAVNVHHHGNPFNAIAKHVSGRSSIEDEVRRACRFVRERTTGDTVSVVVSSNHDDMLRRWIVGSDWKADPVNAQFYLAAALEMVKGVRMTSAGTSYPSPFTMVFPSMVSSMEGIKLLRGDESFRIANIEVGMHGDRGPNGSRGSLRNLRRIGIRSIVGHSHTAGIDEGSTQVGTSTELKLEYTGGPSSWMNAHCLIHDDGKRQLVFIIDGEYRG